MKTFNLQLIGFPGIRGGKNRLPYSPHAYICVRSRSKIKYPNKKGNVERNALSNECVSFQELEAEADRLIEELQNIKKQGRRLFKK